MPERLTEPKAPRTTITRTPPPVDRVTYALVALRVTAGSTQEAWETLEHGVAPAVMAVDGVYDLHLPRRRDIEMTGPGEARCRMRLTLCAPSERAAFALADGPVRRALARLAPDVSIVGVASPVENYAGAAGARNGWRTVATVGPS